MTRSVLIQQLFHGYRRGHEQLAASTRLSQADSDLVTRLSDLSGTLLSGFIFESYLTVYPLPSSQFYAVALTRPDPSAPRAGCVLTHTLLLEMEDWSTLAAPKEISSLFVKTAKIPDQSISALEHTPGPSLLPCQSGIVSPEDQDFVGRYFGEGIRPVIWVDAPDPEGKLWAIITGSWPALRRSFAACTLCLQPRNLQNRPFDVMFAPRAASSRFSRLGSDHFVASSLVPSEPWQHEFTMQLFGGAHTDPESSVLNSVLDDSPVSIRKLFLFRELWSRSADKPTAAIGVFDLLESIHAPETTSHLQSLALNRALSSFGTLSSSERLELFSMLLLRISRVHGNGHQQDESFEGLLAVLSKDVLTEFPDAVLSEIEKAWPKLKVDQTFKTTFMMNLAMALPENPTLAVAVAGRPDIGKELVAEYPVAVARALSTSGARLLLDQIFEWLNEASFREKLPSFRGPFLGQLKADHDGAFIRKMLADIHEEEVVPLLGHLFGDNGLPYQNNEVREVVIDCLARPFPILTREWIEASDLRDAVVEEVLSATYPPNAPEHLNILTSPEPDLGFRRRVLANWIVRNSAYNIRFVREIGNVALHDPVVLESLTEQDCGEAGARALQIVLESVGSIPTNSERLLRNIFLYRPRNLKLIDIALRSFIADYIRSGESATSLETVLGEAAFTEWLGGGQTWRLAGTIRGAIVAKDACSRAWQVIYKLPVELYNRDLVVNTIDSLLDSTAQYCSLSVVQTWTEVIRRARNSSSDETFGIDLCGQVIRFAFENPRLPVSKLVVEGFLPLYKFVTEVKRVPSTAAALFSYWNWDKGSELREALTDKFLIGSWPPGDLALAVGDFGLLRKLLKRISRKRGGHSFARKMYSDLASNSDAQSRSLANNLAGLLRNPDYDEEWD